VCVPFLYSSARAATSSRQKSGMSGTTRPQTEWKAGERRGDTSPTISWAAWKGPSLRLVWVLVWDARWRLEVGSLLPPSSGPTQVGTTRSLTFRAIVGPEGRVEMYVTL
jgi:hypothetical protein